LTGSPATLLVQGTQRNGVGVDSHQGTLYKATKDFINMICVLCAASQQRFAEE
jgi:hypothetical protein